MTEPIELLPCPFCGAAAHFEMDEGRWEWVECESCGMQGNRSASLMEDCKPKLTEEWNRRTPQPTQAQAEAAYQSGYMDGMAKGRRDVEAAPKQEAQEPVAGHCRFPGVAWAECSPEHVRMVRANPEEWKGYEVRYLYAEPQPSPAAQEGKNNG